MKKIETQYIDKTARNFLDVLKQTEYYIASATARDVDVLKLVCSPEETLSKVVKSSLRRASRKCKSMGKIEFFIFGEDFHPENFATDYLCGKAEYVKDDEDFDANNENIVILYIKQKNKSE